MGDPWNKLLRYHYDMLDLFDIYLQNKDENFEKLYFSSNNEDMSLSGNIPDRAWDMLGVCTNLNFVVSQQKKTSHSSCLNVLINLT